MKVHYGNSATGREKDYDYNAHKKAQSDEVDRILEKLKKSGYDSLTTEEKKKLHPVIWFTISRSSYDG